MININCDKVNVDGVVAVHPVQHSNIPHNHTVNVLTTFYSFLREETVGVFTVYCVRIGNSKSTHSAGWLWISNLKSAHTPLV